MLPSPEHHPFRRDVAGLIFLTLLGCYAYFWQARCWNSASRLMLTYSIGDRGTIAIDGLEQQTRDRAYVNGHYFCDKPPGQSFLAVPVYGVVRLLGSKHSLDREPFAYWWPDYVLTVATSGMLTAVLGVALYVIALGLGCRQGAAALVALSYGLGTPAFTYATLFYGHQTAAFCAFVAFSLLDRNRRLGRWTGRNMFAAGLLAGYAVVAEYPMVFVSFGLLAYAIWYFRSIRAIMPFCNAAAICATLLAVYHTAAFGGPLQLGYFSETEAPFQEIYSESNPIGLTRPRLFTAVQILFSPHGLLLFAPITVLSVAGIAVLVARRQWELVAVVVWSFGSLFLINASHPTWTGGFATGPRYVLPAVPFLMMAVAALLSVDRAWLRVMAGSLAVVGFAIVGSCTAYGGRLPDVGTPDGDNPLVESVWPAWTQGHFDRNLGKLLLYPWWWDIPERWKWIAFIPLGVFLILMLLLLRRACVRATTAGETPSTPSGT